MHNSSQSHKGSSKKAIAWALLSQSIWLPLILVDLHDRWQADSGRTAGLPTTKDPADPFLARNIGRDLLDINQSTNLLIASQLKLRNRGTGVILNATQSQSRLLRTPISSSYTRSDSPSPLAYTAPLAPNFSSFSTSHSNTPSLGIGLSPQPALHAPTLPGIIGRFYSRAELLGGTITLQNLNEVEMPPVARAERAKWSRSKDPLAPIPEVWRESIRSALKELDLQSSQANKLTSNQAQSLEVDFARVVHVPSSKVRHASQVPLALQSDGTVDILSHPDDPAVVEEIKTWSSKQAPPSEGRMIPTIVHLHPLPAAKRPVNLQENQSNHDLRRSSSHNPHTSSHQSPGPYHSPISAPAPEPAAAPVALADSPAENHPQTTPIPSSGANTNMSTSEALPSNEVTP